jgi:hypothetical protein
VREEQSRDESAETVVPGVLVVPGVPPKCAGIRAPAEVPPESRFHQHPEVNNLFTLQNARQNAV